MLNVSPRTVFILFSVQSQHAQPEVHIFNLRGFFPSVKALQFELCFSRFLDASHSLHAPWADTWWTEQDVEPVGGCFIGVIGFSCGWSDGMSVEADLKFKRSASVPDTQLLSCEHREYHEYQQRNTYGIFSPLKSIPLAELMEMIVKPQALDQSFWRHIRLSSWQIGSYPGSNRKDAWVRGIGDIQRAWKRITVATSLPRVNFFRMVSWFRWTTLHTDAVSSNQLTRLQTAGASSRPVEYGKRLHKIDLSYDTRN